MHFVRRAIIFVLLAGICAGCTTSQPPVVLDRVGPITGRVGRGLSSEDGYLQVFSATEERNSGDILYYPHTPYSVYTPGGKHVEGVVNSAGFIDQRPMVMHLAPGEYVVHARSDRYGMVRVPVVIVSGQLTVLYLEGNGWAATDGIAETDLVRLPDGRVAGRRGSASEPPPKPKAK